MNATNNFQHEITATLMLLLQQHYNQQIFIDPDEKKFLRKKITEEGSLYYPITNNSGDQILSPILGLNENRLFSIKDVIRASKSVEKRIFNGTQALQMRVTYRTESENEPQKSVNEPTQKRNPNRTKSEKRADKKRVELLRFNGLEPFHDTYIDKRFDVILELEKLTYELILNGSENVKTWAKDNFKQAQKIAKNDTAGLITLLERTHKKRNQQLAAIKTNQSKTIKKKLSDKVKIFLVVGGVGLALIFGIISSVKNKIKAGNNPAYNESIISNDKVYSQTQIDSLIDVFEVENNTKIYVWRRNQIFAAFPSTGITESQATAIIDSIANYNFKTNTTSNNPPKQHTQTNQNKPKTGWYDPNTGIGYNPNL